MGCYDLKWESHPLETLKSMSELRARSIFVDLTLFCGNRVFSMHRVVAAASSGYLNRVLRLTNNSSHDSSDPRGRNVVIALPPTVSPELLALAIDFMYTGEISLDSLDLEDFMKVADALEIRGLRRTNVQSVPPTKKPKLTETVPPPTPQPQPEPERPVEKCPVPALKAIKTELEPEPEIDQPDDETFDEIGPDTDEERSDSKSVVSTRDCGSEDSSSQPSTSQRTMTSSNGPLVKVGSFLWRGTMVGTGIPFYSCDKCSYTTLHPEKGLRHDLLHLNAIAQTGEQS